jgi:hypothetical protein
MKRSVYSFLLTFILFSVELPSLKDVKGGVTVFSTTDISAFCGFFDTAKTKKIIQGQESCKSNVKAANEGGSDGDSGTSGSGSSSNTSGNGTDNAVAALSVNNVLLGVSVIAGMAQLW